MRCDKCCHSGLHKEQGQDGVKKTLSTYIWKDSLKRCHCRRRGTLPSGDESDYKGRLTCNLENEKEEIKKNITVI